MAEAKKSGGFTAATDIQHGTLDNEGKNKQVSIAAGESVNKGDFSDDEWEALVAAGAIEDEGPNGEEAPVNASVTEQAGVVPQASGSELDATGGTSTATSKAADK